MRSQYNALNFSYEYNDAGGGNFTGASAVINIFICPSAVRGAGTTRDTVSGDPNASAYEKTQTAGYGYADYGPSVYTDINVVNGVATPGPNYGTADVPYRNKAAAAKGLLKDGKTSIAEIIDGTSNTIAILEVAGRDERFVSQYLEQYYLGVDRPGDHPGQRARGRPDGAAPVLEVGRPGQRLWHFRTAE